MRLPPDPQEQRQELSFPVTVQLDDQSLELKSGASLPLQVGDESDGQHQVAKGLLPAAVVGRSSRTRLSLCKSSEANANSFCSSELSWSIYSHHSAVLAQHGWHQLVALGIKSWTGVLCLILCVTSVIRLPRQYPRIHRGDGDGNQDHRYQGCARAAEQLKAKGSYLILICAHPGWGEPYFSSRSGLMRHCFVIRSFSTTLTVSTPTLIRNLTMVGLAGAGEADHEKCVSALSPLSRRTGTFRQHFQASSFPEQWQKNQRDSRWHRSRAGLSQSIPGAADAA